MNYNIRTVIDWYHVTANAVWILACAIALATLSYASWVASIKHEKLRNVLKLNNYQTSMNIAGILFCLGLAGVSDKWWEIALWLLIAALFSWQTLMMVLYHLNKLGKTKRN
jgi:hypothetical protein